MERLDRLSLLINAVGIDSESFYDFVEWALDELLIKQLIQNDDYKEIMVRNEPNRLREFSQILTKSTGRNWSHDQVKTIYEACRQRTQRKQYREPIETGDYLKLLWSSDPVCKKCGRRPPEVKLHIDHVFPVSMGGSSRANNLQFLCSECNLKKSDKVEGGIPWLNLV